MSVKKRGIQIMTQSKQDYCIWNFFPQTEDTKCFSSYFFHSEKYLVLSAVVQYDSFDDSSAKQGLMLLIGNERLKFCPHSQTLIFTANKTAKLSGSSQVKQRPILTLKLSKC